MAIWEKLSDASDATIATATLAEDPEGTPLTPAFKNAGSAKNSSTTVANPTSFTPEPGARNVGDLLLCFTSSRSKSATINTPSGWTQLVAVHSATESGGSLYVLGREATNTASDNCALTWTGLATGSSGDSCSAVILCWENAVPVLGATTTSKDEAVTTAMHLPAVTTTVNNAMRIGYAMRVEDTARTFTVETLTERFESATITGTGHGFEISDLLVASAGASAEKTVTPSGITSARALTLSMAVKPRKSSKTKVGRLGLTAGTTPKSRENHKIKVRAKKASGSGTVKVNAAIYEGANNRSTDKESSAITTSLADYELTITKAQAEAIASYGELELRLWGTSSTADLIAVEVADARLLVPEGEAGGKEMAPIILQPHRGLVLIGRMSQ